MESTPIWSLIEALWLSVWLENPLPGKVIILVTLALAVSGARQALRHTRRYDKFETSNLWRLTQTLRTLRETPPPASPANEAVSPDQVSAAPAAAVLAIVPVDDLKAGIDANSLVGERLDAIARLRRQHVRVTAPVLQALTWQREDARSGIGTAAFVMDATIMLGLFGTFVGLAIVVQRIDLGLPRATAGLTLAAWGEAVQGVRLVLGGMKTAFSCSLVGLCCAIACASLNYRLRTHQAAFLERLDAFTITDLLPATVPAVEEENLLERVTFQLQTSFDRLDEIFDQNKETLKDLTAAQQTFLDIVQEVRTITRGEASRDLDRVIEESARANHAVVSLVEHLERFADSVHQGHRSLLQAMSNITSKIHDVARSRSESTVFALGRAALLFGAGAAVAMLARRLG